MEPIAASDAMRVLPGSGRERLRASVEESHRSFVRGGESTYNKIIVDGVTVNDARPDV